MKTPHIRLGLAPALFCLAVGPASAADFSLGLDLGRTVVDLADPVAYSDDEGSADSKAVEIMYHANEYTRTFVGFARVDAATGFECAGVCVDSLDTGHDAWRIGVEGRLPLGETFGFVARVARQRMEFEITGATAWDTLAGLGVDWRFAPRWTLRLVRTGYDEFDDRVTDTALGVRYDLD